MKYGWFKMNREIFTDEILCHNSEHLAVWCYLCANAVYKETQARFAGKLVTLQPGQLITGRKVIAIKFITLGDIPSFEISVQ